MLELVLATVISTWVNPRTFTLQFTRCHSRIPAPWHFIHNLVCTAESPGFQRAFQWENKRRHVTCNIHYQKIVTDKTT